MNIKKVIISFACIFAVLASLCFIMNKKLNNGMEEEIAVYLNADTVSKINVEGREEAFSWIKQGDKWSIPDMEIELDDSLIEQYIFSVMQINGRLVEKNCSSLYQYGLDNPQVRLEYISDDKIIKELRLGNKTPAETEYYMCDEENNLYVIYTSSGNEMKKMSMDFADTFICAIPYNSIVKIEVSGDDGFSVNNNGTSQWTVEKDGTTQAIDTETVKIKITKNFGKMYAMNILHKTEENLKKYTQNTKPVTVTVYLADGNARRFTIIDMTEDKCFFTLDDGKYIYEATSNYFEFINGI